jgi:hypothetical protein
MHAGLLAKLFGSHRAWHGPCTVVVDAEATIEVSGTDAIVNAGAKMYAPRLISGRVNADAVAYLPDEAALVVVQWERIRQVGGQDQFQQTTTALDAAHIAAIEFATPELVANLGLADPPRPTVGPAKPRG